MTIHKATASEIQKAIAELGSWTVESGKLHQEYRSREFVEAFGFMAQASTGMILAPMRSGITFPHPIKTA